MTRIRLKHPHNLSPEELETCARLTARWRGAMEGELRRIAAPLPTKLVSRSSAIQTSRFDLRDVLQLTQEESWAVLLEEDDQLVAWSLLFPNCLWKPDGSVHVSHRTAYFYVRPNCRRQGYGSRLACKVAKLYPEIKVRESSRANRAFFKRHPQLEVVDS